MGLGGGIAAAAIAAGGALIGSKMSGKKARAEAKRNRRFQERMSSTAYQRATADMRAAGINPLLAYSQGGSSTPGGSMAAIPDYGKAAATGVQAFQANANVDNTEAGTRLLDAQAEKAETMAEVWSSAKSAVRGIKGQFRPILDWGTQGLEIWNEKPGGGGTSAVQRRSIQRQENIERQQRRQKR